MDIRSMQAPLKEGYRADPASSRITLSASAGGAGSPVRCSVEVGRAVHAAEAHPGVGGPGAAACSGDLLLGALAACAQVTCQMVAAAMELPVRGVAVTAEGDLDLQGTLGTRRDVPVGFAAIRLRFELDAPELDEAARRSLVAKTERYCVVMQTLVAPPRLLTDWR
ncbi:OsmC family protein [Miltoncostaea marina]|uniref:OsmC family protein n=1 Tax=Miltoncostaea marina TaxID=2843215 RepID=UPI001C3D5092|nr:OsmC family protein [Miltoncostaea marina]